MDPRHIHQAMDRFRISPRKVFAIARFAAVDRIEMISQQFSYQRRFRIPVFLSLWSAQCTGIDERGNDVGDLFQVVADLVQLFLSLFQRQLPFGMFLQDLCFIGSAMKEDHIDRFTLSGGKFHAVAVSLVKGHELAAIHADFKRFCHRFRFVSGHQPNHPEDKSDPHR